MCSNTVELNISDLVLEARPWPRGTLRPKFMALASGPMALTLKAQALALALRAALTIFGITLKLKQSNKLIIAIVIN